MRVEVRKVKETRRIAGIDYKYPWAVFVNGEQTGLFFKKKNAEEFAEKGAEVCYKAVKGAIKSLRKIRLGSKGQTNILAIVGLVYLGLLLVVLLTIF